MDPFFSGAGSEAPHRLHLPMQDRREQQRQQHRRAGDRVRGWRAPVVACLLLLVVVVVFRVPPWSRATVTQGANWKREREDGVTTITTPAKMLLHIQSITYLPNLQYGTVLGLEQVRTYLNPLQGLP